MRTGTARALLTDDGFYVPVDATEWSGGSAVVDLIDAAIPTDRVVLDEPRLNPGRGQVDELAAATFKRTWLVSEELEALPQLLDEDEALLVLAAGSRGWRYGLLALTDRRLRFVYKALNEHSFVVERGPLPVRSRGSTLDVFVDDEWISLTDVSPKGKAQELEQLLRSWGQPEST